MLRGLKNRLLRTPEPSAAPSPLPLTRFEQAMRARGAMGNDFFGGWEPGDAALFQRHAQASKATEGKITDFLGIKTATGLHPWAGHMNGTVNPDIPIPDDSLRAEAIEYFAVLHSLETAAADRYTLVELGASYAPWTCTAAVLAKRTGRKTVRVVAVEAGRLAFDMIPGHLAENGVSADEVEIRLINGAIADKPGPMFFPKLTDIADNGSQATGAIGSADYLGREIEHEEVAGYVLADVLPDGLTDILHVDIQGSETALLRANIGLLNERVRTVFIGTHARRIEGELLDLFSANEWQLVRERPTQFTSRSHLPDIVGWTTRDGGQYWCNRRFFAADAFP